MVICFLMVVWSDDSLQFYHDVIYDNMDTDVASKQKVGRQAVASNQEAGGCFWSHSHQVVILVDGLHW